jgi:hypothetical protein
MLRREARISPFVFSLLLHALATVLVVTGLAAPANESATAKLAELFPQPEAVNVRLVEASDVPELAPDEPAQLLSERDSRAADRAPRDLPEGAPFNRGETTVPNASPGEGGRDQPRAPEASAARPPAAAAERSPAEKARRAGQPAAGAPNPAGRATDTPAGVEPSTAGDLAAGSDASRLAQAQPQGQSAPTSTLGDGRLALPRRDIAVPQSAAPGALKPPGTGRRGLPQVDNRLSRARFDGEFSLSTYAWDYAPYMTRLKKQIEDYTWTILPSAFWYGIAAWDTQVRFTILPDGRLESVAITGHDGVLELRHVASDAVTGSADFEPLPTGFPDPKLTIVGNFYFNEFPPARGAADSRSPPAGGRGDGAAEGAGAARGSGASEGTARPTSAGQAGAARGDS